MNKEHNILNIPKEMDLNAIQDVLKNLELDYPKEAMDLRNQALVIEDIRRIDAKVAEKEEKKFIQRVKLVLDIYKKGLKDMKKQD